ncbi:MAG: AIR synthase-related protein [Spirochaetota bacterium]|nr:AIR synthase-related protein [Spirochaetota bacterium]
MGCSKIRIEVFYIIPDSREDILLKKINRLGFHLNRIFITDNYLINADLSNEDILRIAKSIIQPVTQDYKINIPHYPDSFDYAVEIGFLPGVTDNISNTARETIEDLLKKKFEPQKSIFTSKTYFFSGNISREEAYSIGLELHNPLIHRMHLLSHDDYLKNDGMGLELPVVRMRERSESIEVDMEMSDDDLMILGKEGIADEDGKRRGTLALDMLSLKAIRDYFKYKECRNPTDIELESIAQTWSEHCKHRIFASRLDDIDEGIFKRYIKQATERIISDRGDDFCVSVFEDNSGGIKFDENYVISDKVETHNSPSALDPFGGAITGIVGVNRDTIGFGLGAKPIANRFGFCFASPFDNRSLYRDKDENSKLLPPRRIMEGVIHGVNVGGNCSGIPTPQGFIYFDERYRGKPLVFVGTIGLIPRYINGKSSVHKCARDGDNIVVIGGRVGRDGIHGATFSSEALTHGSPATAVQIGDPITQKKFSDAITKEAMDKRLYNSITDNGAGGLSCSVAEMGRESGGFEVNLNKVPLKYSGLAPWQIWVSESQERMTLAVPPEKLEEFIGLMERRGVETAVIGRFNNTGRGVVAFNGRKIFDLDMQFLHEGLPQKILKTNYNKKSNPYPPFPKPDNLTKVFCDMISRLNTSSFEFISSQYDHEVQAGSVIKPLQGRGRANSNATVIKPQLDSLKGVVISQGLYPSYGDIDTYWMAACSIDTAIRNAISVGGTLKRIALLDNFCWCDSENPTRLAELKDAARACYDFAVAYGTPYISGKDSMFNDFRGYDENYEEVFISIPPTLLISSIGIVENVNRCQTIDFKFEGDQIYILGKTEDEIGGSEYLAYIGEKTSGRGYIGDNIPKVDSTKNMDLYKAFETATERELLASSISIERGGIGVAISKSAIAGMRGFTLDLSRIPAKKHLRIDTLLYSESQGRFLVTVNRSKIIEFERIFRDLPVKQVGEVLKDDRIEIKNGDDSNLIMTDVIKLRDSYKELFKDM